MPKTKRIEFRIEPDKEQRIRKAAELADENLSSFVVAAALDRADEVTAKASATVVPAAFFDALWVALDGPPQPSPALARVARRPRRVRQA